MTAGDAPPEATDVSVGDARTSDLSPLPNIRAVVLPWAGAGPEIVEAVRSTDRRVTLHNLHDNADATAEQAITLLLAACRRVVPMDRSLRHGRWPGRSSDDDSFRKLIVLNGKRAVVLGFGQIGRRIGRVLEALGLTVTGITRSGRDGTTSIDQLAAVLPTADVLISALPSTDATRGLLDDDAFAAMPAGAVVVNVGRGDVMVEQSLFDACRSGHIAAAGLDVWWRYPHSVPEGEREMVRPGDCSWHELDNVVMSPHVAGAWAAAGRQEKRADALADLLSALARGEEKNVIDLQTGY